MSSLAIRLLTEMRDVSNGILGLDFNNETDLIRLQDLQRKQFLLREEMDRMSPSEKSSISQDMNLKQLVVECIEIESHVREKLLAAKNDASKKLNSLKKFSNAWERYQFPYRQAEGYFIDKKSR